MRHRLEWFVKPEWPTYAAWWVADDHRPDWHEASDRLEQLHDRGSNPHAFDFRAPFGPDGRPATVDRAAVLELAGRRAAGSVDQEGLRVERDAILVALKAGVERAAPPDGAGAGPARDPSAND